MSSSSSSLLFPATLILLLQTLALLLIISPLPSADAVTDVDLDPVYNNGSYYILKAGTNRGLTFIRKNNTCPLYITLDDDGGYPTYGLGTRVKISISQDPWKKLHFVLNDIPVNMEFGYSPVRRPCKDSSPVWQIMANGGEQYITTGGSRPGSEFIISQNNKATDITLTYSTIKYCPSTEGIGLWECYDLALIGDDGLLGLTKANPTQFEFSQA